MWLSNFSNYITKTAGSEKWRDPFSFLLCSCFLLCIPEGKVDIHFLTQLTLSSFFESLFFSYAKNLAFFDLKQVFSTQLSPLLHSYLLLPFPLAFPSCHTFWRRTKSAFSELLLAVAYGRTLYYICNQRTLKFLCTMGTDNTCEKTSVSDFHFPSTCSVCALKFWIAAFISSQTLFFPQFTFLKSFSCSLYWEINNRVSSLLHQKYVRLPTASTSRRMLLSFATCTCNAQRGIIMVRLSFRISDCSRQ